MKPLWEIYTGKDMAGQGVWFLNGQALSHPVMFVTLEDLHNYMSSFHEAPKERAPTKVRSGDASTPKHPYDRTDDFWEKQHEKMG